MVPSQSPARIFNAVHKVVGKTYYHLHSVSLERGDSAELCGGSRSRGRVQAPGTEQRRQVGGTPATRATPDSHRTPTVCAAGSVQTSLFCGYNNPARRTHYTCPARKEAEGSTGFSDLPRATRRGGQGGLEPTSQPGL